MSKRVSELCETADDLIGAAAEFGVHDWSPPVNSSDCAPEPTLTIREIEKAMKNDKQETGNEK
jgi:hypothetical protein